MSSRKEMAEKKYFLKKSAGVNKDTTIPGEM